LLDYQLLKSFEIIPISNKDNDIDHEHLLSYNLADYFVYWKKKQFFFDVVFLFNVSKKR
jgi:hypothetical protein